MRNASNFLSTESARTVEDPKAVLTAIARRTGQRCSQQEVEVASIARSRRAIARRLQAILQRCVLLILEGVIATERQVRRALLARRMRGGRVRAIGEGDISEIVIRAKGRKERRCEECHVVQVLAESKGRNASANDRRKWHILIDVCHRCGVVI